MDPGNFVHWKTKQDSDGILWLCLDRVDKEINTLSREVLHELDQMLADIQARPPAGIVLYSGKKSGFIAGADVTEFSEVSNSSEAIAYVTRVHGILDRLEQFPIPTVCVIQGHCLGGGLELALACRYRIAVQSPQTGLGLPEVRLGIHPGFGGTVRLIHQVGPLKAMDMMLSGRIIDARRSFRIGLVDYTVPERQWTQAAQAVLKQSPRQKPTEFPGRILQLRPSRFLLSRYLRRKISGRVNRKHYPAPYALIDLWERYGGNPTVMDREECRSVSGLVTNDTARNLTRIFRLQEHIRGRSRKGEQDFRSVHVIGAGTMGADIASWCALQGLRVTLQDVEHQRLARAIERASALFRKKLKGPRLVQSALDRFIPDLDGYGIGQADVVIEAVFEDASVKSTLYEKIEPHMRPDALLATNTSSIPLERLSRSLQRPDRFVGLHFFNPVSKMQLVEVIRSADVAVEAFNRAISFISAIRRLPIPVSSSPGFLVNRILTPYILEAILMEEEGSSPDVIDRAALEFGMPMGPIELADTVGLDICLSAGRILSEPLNLEAPKRLEDLVKAGRLGKKSGRGFYRYKKGQKVGSGKKKPHPAGEDIADRLILRLLNEAVACRREGIVSDENFLDAGVVFGIGFAPFRGGPMHYIRSQGIDAMLDHLKSYETRYGKRFVPDPGWHELGMQEPGQI